MRFHLQLAFTLLVCAFLIVPVVLSMLAGVTENFFVGLSSGFTLRWVQQVWDTYQMTIWRSIIIALACLLVTLLVGVPLAYMLARYKGGNSRLARVLEELLMMPVAVPGLATALALIMAYGQYRAFRGSLLFILVGHVLFTLPFIGAAGAGSDAIVATGSAGRSRRQPWRRHVAALLRRGDSECDVRHSRRRLDGGDAVHR